MKNIIKIILKMVVTAGILAGLCFGIFWLTTPKNDYLKISNQSTEMKIESKLFNEQDYDMLEQKANKCDNHIETNNICSAIVDGSRVIDVLTRYYKHYVPLTVYENNIDSGLRDQIIEKMGTLNQKLDKTKTRFQELNTIFPDDKINNTDINFEEAILRINNVFFAMKDETISLFDICSDLKDYVYATNYQTTNMVTPTETLLEIMKDYSSVAFDAELKNYTEGSYTASIFSQSDNLSFTSCYIKMTSKTSLDLNNETELKVVNYYSQINEKFLTAYYQKDNQAKIDYVLAEINFTEKAPIDETAEEKTLREAQGHTQTLAMVSLNNYLSLSAF